MARRVSIAQLKARLSEFLQAVRAGEEVVVTDRGRPVARITALEGEEGRDARTEALVRAGLASPPSRSLDAAFFRVKRPVDPEGRLVEALLDERMESG